jgi:hypothetical protein
VTEVAASGRASASGAHVIVTGGVVRTVDQADPACRTEVSVQAGLDQNHPIFLGLVLEPEQGDVTFAQQFGGAPSSSSLRDQTGFQPFGAEGCAADQVANPGNRELFVGATELNVGSGSGALAAGSGLTYGTNDVSGEDVKSAGTCERGPLTNLFHGTDPGADDTPDDGEPSGFVSGCDQFWDYVTGRETDPDTGEHKDTESPTPAPDPREGTVGRDGRGFPVPGAHCADYGGTPPPTDHAGGDLATAGPTAALHAAEATCQADAVGAGATAATAALAIPDPSGAAISVARISSRVASTRTAAGQVTVAFASAEGVRIGPLSIRELRSVAITTAHGHTDTATTVYSRSWCGLTLADEAHPNAEPQEAIPGTGTGCVAPDAALVASLNQVLPRIHLNLPAPNSEKEADGHTEDGQDSPGGYQATLVKDPDTRGGDQAVNDDESYTVAALEAVVYNDGTRGRNRLVVQLAGVHAESRYGITPLPSFGDCPDCEPPEATTTTTTEVPPSTDTASPGTSTAFVPGDDYITDEVPPEDVRTVAFGRPLPRGRNPLVGILRAPLEALRDAIQLLITHPGEFALLFVMWSLLAAPLYQFLRRRAFARALLGASGP